MILLLCDIDVVDINECSSSPCQNGAVCTDAVNSYTCACAAGYTGTHCETGECMGLSNSCNRLSTYNVKRHFFDTAVGPHPNFARICALRRDWLSPKKNVDPPHPILIETRSYRRPSGRLQAVRCGQITYASLRFAFWGNVTLSTSTHRQYDESVHRIKQLTLGNNTIPYHRL